MMKIKMELEMSDDLSVKFVKMIADSVLGSTDLFGASAVSDTEIESEEDYSEEEEDERPTIGFHM